MTRKVLAESAELRISGGMNTKPGEYPWMAHISLPSSKSCGGVLISCNHVLTAAHCIDPFDESSLIKEGKVTLGGVSPDRGVTFGIQEAIVHPDFDPDGFNSKSDETIHNDLAIVVLDGTTRIKAVAMEKKSPRPGAKGLILGWGETESSSSSSVLQKTTVSIMRNEDCEGTVPKKYFDSDSSICTGPDLDRPQSGGTYTSACSGDSGGPMIDTRSKRLLGIISYSFSSSSSGDCGDERQTVLASVQDGIDMIQETIGDSTCRNPIKPDDDKPSKPTKPNGKPPRPDGKRPGSKKPPKNRGKKRHA